MLTNIFDSQKSSEILISDTIQKIKNGDQELKNIFITQYQPFIIKTVSNVLGNKYIAIENSEEFSIALMAFDEAIQCYDESKNRNFFDFAKQVIKRRIINYWAANNKNLCEYPFTYFQKDNQEYWEEVPQQTMSLTRNYEIKEEVLIFTEQLAGFGITLTTLVSNTPKHRDSKLLAISIARIIATNDDLYEQMIKRRVLPMAELLKLVNVNKKTVERHRQYVIAISLVLRSELEILKDYIYQAERRCR